MKKAIRKQKGFSFIEIMIVIAIIGVLTAVGVFNISSPLQNSKIDQTVQIVKMIQADLEVYFTQRGMLDNTKGTVTTVATNFIVDFNQNYSSMDFSKESIKSTGNAFYVFTEIKTDAWGNKFVIYYSFDNNICIVASAGGNGTMDFLTEKDADLVDDIMAVMRKK